MAVKSPYRHSANHAINNHNVWWETVRCDALADQMPYIANPFQRTGGQMDKLKLFSSVYLFIFAKDDCIERDIQIYSLMFQHDWVHSRSWIHARFILADVNNCRTKSECILQMQISPPRRHAMMSYSLYQLFPIQKTM